MYDTLPSTSKSCVDYVSETEFADQNMPLQSKQTSASSENDLSFIHVKIKPVNDFSQSQKETYNKQLLKIFELSKNNEFPTKIFNFNDVEKSYSPIYNFFHCKQDFSKKPEKNIEFVCLICHISLSSKIGFSTNLQHHLVSHKQYNDWKVLYEKHKTSTFKAEETISSKTFKLVQFFVETNVPIVSLENKHLRQLLSSNDFKIPSKKTFTKSVLPSVYNRLNKEFEKKLKNSKYVILIVDIWTNAQMTDFLGLGAVIIDTKFNREIVVIGIDRMPGGHNAENISKVIETIVNRF